MAASLKINGVEVLDSANSGAAAQMSTALQGGVAALFLEDANKNGKSDVGLAYSTTFIAWTDAFISATQPAFVDMTARRNVLYRFGRRGAAPVLVPVAATASAHSEEPPR